MEYLLLVLVFLLGGADFAPHRELSVSPAATTDAGGRFDPDGSTTDHGGLFDPHG